MIHLTARFVATYIREHKVEAGVIPDLIRSIYSTLSSAASPNLEPVERQKPAVPIKKSITPSAIICLDCGKPQKMIKRHLTVAHGLSVDEYRAKWSLRSDYPMVAAEYAAVRSQLAFKAGLGTKRARKRKAK